MPGYPNQSYGYGPQMPGGYGGPGGYSGYGGYGGYGPMGGVPLPGMPDVGMPPTNWDSGVSNNFNIAYKATLSEGKADKLADRQSWISAGSQALNTIGKGIEMFLQHDIATDKIGLMSKYYDTVGKVDASHQAVSLRELSVRSEGIQAEKEIALDTNKTKVQLGTIEAQLQASLARIGEDGRTRRTEIIVANNAFQASPDVRSMYFNGNIVT